MHLTNQNKKALKIGGGIALAFVAAIAIKKAVDSHNTPAPTTVRVGNEPAPRPNASAIPQNMGAVYTPTMGASSTPSTSTGGGGGLINTLASNPFINPLAIVPKIGGLLGGGGLFGR